MRKGGGGFQSHNIFDVLEDTQNKKTRNNNESDDDSSDDEEQSYYCLEISGLPLFVEKTQFLPIASDFGTVTHIDCEKSGYVYVFYEQKHVATKTLMSIDGKRYQGKRMTVQFAPNKALPAVKKCYHCDKLGHFGIDCVEGALASMPEEIIALMCSFASLHQYNTTPMRVNKKWKRAITTHTTYLEVHSKWSPLFDKFSNLNTLFVYNTTPNNLKCFPKLQTLVADIHVLNRLIDHEFPPSLKNIKADCVNYMVSALPQTWMQRTELAGLESLSFHEDIGGGLPFTFADVTHLTNLRRLDLLTRTSPKEHLSSLTRLEHLGCAAFDDLTPLDAKYLQRLTSFAALKYNDYNMTGLDINGGSYTWLADLTQMKAISLRNIENNYNFKLWPNIQSLTIADVPHLPDTLDQLNVAQITELNLKIRSMGRFSKLSEFTNLVKLNIEAEAAANSIFLEIVKLKNLRHLEFKADEAFKAVDDDTIVGLADMPNLEHFSLTGSVNAIEALFLDEICELSTLTSITFQYGFENPRFMDIIRRFNKVKTITIWGSEGIYYHHVIILRHKLKGPEKITFNGADIKNITECLCKECRERNLASSLDHLAIDPAPAVLAMEDHMLDVDEIRGGRSDEREKKLRKHDKTKMQRIEKQGNLSEKELRKKRNRRK